MRKLLFVIDSLDIAGAEKSLVSLLNLLDYQQVSVDLQLFAYGNPLEALVPKEVNILKPLEYTRFAALTMKKACVYALKHKHIATLMARMKYSFAIRRDTYSNPQKARLFWETISNVIEPNLKHYDVAISYAQGIPTFYVAEKVQAAKKLAWVNVSYRLDDNEQAFHRRFYDCVDGIVAVSDSTREVFVQTFPYYKEKIEVIYDVNNPHFILKMADIGNGFTDDFDGIRLLTIGRLAHQKGYDIALEACRRLKTKGIRFRWYALGKGPLQKDIEQQIRADDLTDTFVLLGVKANPYAYIKQADIYVQTSRFEGFGLAIAEARMLNVPVVTTRFDAVNNQMLDGKNGLVVEMNAQAVSEAIEALIFNRALKERICHYLAQEKKGNIEEIEKFYKLIR
ncbi:hypothetical protein GCM10011391_06490 [Pullulanibacillus camelliae]|uniref:Glycosyl transferase family 1 domain-containing protein n=1 Tax=Pullulanibacillus camelliae TaxID=1707096 RepID=A0A8J2VLG5_9BACL|nr:glycosyltransferase [Pullulanibacillus camelliae]GGE30539.1 hypothetical protein GCM10011391_06490 [Pullulanibacillus camelliae]